MKNQLILIIVFAFTLNAVAQTTIIPKTNDSRVITTGVPFLLIAPDAKAACKGLAWLISLIPSSSLT